MKYLLLRSSIRALTVIGLVATFIATGFNGSTAKAATFSCNESASSVKLTTYYPGDGGIEGGYNTSLGVTPYTIDGFVNSNAPYVAVAVDPTLLSACKKVAISIPSLDQKYNNGKPINFRILDTGSAFGGAGMKHFDIALTSKHANDPHSNSGGIYATGTSYTGAVTLQGLASADSFKTTGTGGGTGTAGTGSGAATDTTPNTPLSERIADPGGYVYQSWRALRVVINLVLILALLAISFSNILRINIDTYTIKKALPNLIIGVIMANASFFIVKLFADLASASTFLFINLAGESSFQGFINKIIVTIAGTTAGTVVSGNQAAGANPLIASLATSSNSTLTPILEILASIVAIVGLLWLTIIFYVRLVAIYLLTILSPLAFLSYGVPGFDKYFKQWWQQFIKWMFMLTAITAVLWVQYEICVTRAANNSFAQTITCYVLFFVALSLPSKLGGSVVDKTNNFLKKNPVSKVAGDNAKLIGQNLGSRISERTGLLRLQEWSKLNKANVETKIKNRRDAATGRASLGRSGTRASLLDLEKESIGGTNSIITSRNALRAGQSKQGGKYLENIAVSKKAKEALEADLGTIKAKVDLELLDTKKNTQYKDLIDRWVLSNFENETVKGLLGRNEGIAKSNYAKEIKKPLQALENYNAKQKQLDSLGVNDPQRVQLQAEMDKIKTTFMSGIKSDGSGDFQKLGIFDSNEFQGAIKAGGANNFDSYLKGYKTDELTKRRRKQAFKMETEAVMAEIGDNIKEDTVPQHRAMMNEYWKDMAEAFKKGNGGQDASAAQIAEMKKSLLTGNTAALASDHNIDMKTIDEGVKKLEILKQASNDRNKAEGVLQIFGEEMHAAGMLDNDQLSKMKTNIADRKGQTRAREAIVNNLGGVQGSYSSRVIDSRTGFEPTGQEKDDFVDKLTTTPNTKKGKKPGTKNSTPPPVAPPKPSSYVSPEDMEAMQLDQPDRYQRYVSDPAYQQHRAYDQQMEEYKRQKKQYDQSNKNGPDDDQDEYYDDDDDQANEEHA